MRVILIRHGEAVGSSALGDEGRHLSVRGRQQAAATGEALARRVPTPTHVWASPLVRAQQTAELVVAGFSEPAYPGEIQARDELYPDSPVDSLAEALAQVAANTRGGPDPTVLVVGHMPFMAVACSALLGTQVSGFGTGHAYVLAVASLSDRATSSPGFPHRATLEWRWTGA
jgi:phosphohistidine phosphatase